MASSVKDKPPAPIKSETLEGVEEINIFVSQKQLLRPKAENDLEIPVVTIRVPVDAEDVCSSSASSCNIELKYVPKSLIQDNGPKVQTKKASVQKVILPKAPRKAPVWKREVPKAPGAISNYLYPHDLRLGRSRLIIDCPTNIPVSEFKSQLADTSDIVTTLDVAPSSKKKVKELNTNSVSKLFAYPGKTQPSPLLRGLYQRHLTSKFTQHELTNDLQLPPLASGVTAKPEKRPAPLVQPIVQKKAKPEVETGQQQMVQLVFKQENGTESHQEIIFLDGDGDPLAPDTLQSIQMVLASAESQGVKGQPGEQVFICNSGETEYIIVQNSEVTIEPDGATN